MRYESLLGRRGTGGRKHQRRDVEVRHTAARIIPAAICSAIPEAISWYTVVLAGGRAASQQHHHGPPCPPWKGPLSFSRQHNRPNSLPPNAALPGGKPTSSDRRRTKTSTSYERATIVLGGAAVWEPASYFVPLGSGTPAVI